MVGVELLPNGMVKVATIDPLGRAPTTFNVCPFPAWSLACSATPALAALPFSGT